MFATATRAPQARFLATMAAVALAIVACGGTPAATPTAPPAPTASPIPATNPATPPPAEAIAFDATTAAITVNGDDVDWAEIQGATVTLEQLRLSNLDPAEAAEIDFGPLDPIDVTLKVAHDGDNVYVLLEVPDGFDYDPADHNRSPSLAVMFRIDAPAAPHMGAKEPEIDNGLGMVDMWHWELDCAPGITSGGQAGVEGGDDAACNLDDEYSTNPSDREDDGGGDVENADAENSLTGVWTHSAQASGAGAAGTWIFEMSRPLQTGDPQDGQFAVGSLAYVALAYFDPSEGPDGWTDAGHLQSAYSGWIEVTFK